MKKLWFAAVGCGLLLILGFGVLLVLNAFLMSLPRGPGPGGGQKLTSGTDVRLGAKSDKLPAGIALVVTVDDVHYLVNGDHRSLEQVIEACAAEKAKSDSAKILIKLNDNARYKTYHKLEEELNSRGIRCQIDDTFK